MSRSRANRTMASSCSRSVSPFELRRGAEIARDGPLRGQLSRPRGGSRVRIEGHRDLPLLAHGLPCRSGSCAMQCKPGEDFRRAWRRVHNPKVTSSNRKVTSWLLSKNHPVISMRVEKGSLDNCPAFSGLGAPLFPRRAWFRRSESTCRDNRTRCLPARSMVSKGEIPMGNIDRSLGQRTSTQANSRWRHTR